MTKTEHITQTLDHFIKDTKGYLECFEWDIRDLTNQDETNQEEGKWYYEQRDLCKQRLEHLQQIKSELARLQRYDNELSSVMPKDFEEWPEIAAAVITDRRESEEMAWQQVELAYEEMENKS